MDWLNIEKGVYQGYLLSPCLLNLHAEYIMWNTGLDDSKLKSWLPGEISTTLDVQMITTLVAEVEEELKSCLMRVREENGKNWLKTQHLKNQDHGIQPIISWQINEEKVERVKDLFFSSSKITVDGDCSYKIKRCLLFGRKAMTNLDSRDIHFANKSPYI